MRMPFARRPAEVADVGLADERLLDEHADLVSGRLASRSAQKIGSSVIEPMGSENVHSPSQSSVPVTLMAGTWNRCSIASLVGTQLSVMAGPKTARQPSSTSSP